MEVLQTLLIFLSFHKGTQTGLKQKSPAASYHFLSVLQGSSARSCLDTLRGMGTRWGRPLQGTLTMPGMLSTLMEGGIYSIAPGEVVLLMILSPSSPSGKEPFST